jgi:hypothetical protein
MKVLSHFRSHLRESLIKMKAMSRSISLLACSIALACSGHPSAASGPALFTREGFDQLDRSINNGDGNKSGSASNIAWGESYIMIAYVEMYRVTGDTYYLDQLVDRVDGVLEQRDDNRGFKDYSGRSRAAWSVAGEYTVAELVMKDASGRDVLKFRSVPYAYNQKTRISVTTQSASTDAGAHAGDEESAGINPAARLFGLVIENDRWPPREEYRGLSMDRDSPDFIEKRVNGCDRVALERKLACRDSGSKLVTVEAIGEQPALPAKDASGQALGDQQVSMVPLFMAYHGYSGQATYGMLDFAWLVKNTPQLQARYGAAADRFVAEAVKIFTDADEEWRDGPEAGEGHYVTGERGCPFWSDGIGKAHNYQASLGRSLLRLGQLTGDRKWQGRAESIARLIKNHLRVTEDDGYVWNYWWGLPEQGWTRENSPSFNTPTWRGSRTVEDTSHGHLEIEFVTLCAKAGCVFDAKDMRRFARTFLTRMVDRNKWTISVRVDGSGGWGKHDAVLGGWLELARWEPQVADVGRKIGEAQRLNERVTGAGLMTFARLMKWSMP